MEKQAEDLDKVKINYKELNAEEMNALVKIESGKMFDEPTAAQVIKKFYKGDAREYLKAMGAI